MKKLMFLAAVAFAVSGGTAAQAAVINFDDIASGSFSWMPDGYQGFTWTNFAVINGPLYGDSGYNNGIVSGDQVACACAGDLGQTINTLTAGGALFTLDSGWFTSAWNDGATLLVEGFANGGLLHSASYMLDTSGPDFLSFGWSGIDEVQFSISGGTSAGLPGGGDYFAVDDLSVSLSANGVPEPATWAMLIAGFGLVGASLRRQNRQSATA